MQFIQIMKLVQELTLIKLDWDNIAYYSCMNRIKEIKKHKVVKSIQIFQSPKGDGYHIYIKENYPLTFEEKIHFRRIWKDDPKRIIIDLMKVGKEPTDVLFKYKFQKGIKYSETFIEEIVN